MHSHVRPAVEQRVLHLFDKQVFATHFAQRAIKDLLLKFKELTIETGADNRRIIRGEIVPEEA